VTNRFGEKQYFLDQSGKPIHATLDEKMLTSIADITGGRYYNAKNNDALSSIFQELEQLTKTELKTTTTTIYHPRYEWFLFGILFFMPLWIWLSFARFIGKDM